ncbi:MAG: hypothetical protein ABII90_12385 [Bacteroidota bacterium]
MKKLTFAILCFTLFTFCSSSDEPKLNNSQSQDSSSFSSSIAAAKAEETDTSQYFPVEHPDTISWNEFNIIIHEPKMPYRLQCNDIREKRDSLKILFDADKVSIDTVKMLFTEYLLNKVIPYWYGTKWDFEGHSATPQNGTIACGYFVSTTLRDMGLNLNRYKLAQQYSGDEAKTINLNESVLTFFNYSSGKLIDKVKEKFENGIYLTGLDNHVGFLLKRKGEIFFIHSNYIEPAKVVIERASDSEAFGYSTTFYIGNITNNEKLMKKWLRNDEKKVISGS